MNKLIIVMLDPPPNKPDLNPQYWFKYSGLQTGFNQIRIPNFITTVNVGYHNKFHLIEPVLWIPIHYIMIRIHI